MFFLVCGLVVLRKSSSERVFQDARPWLLVVILSLSTSNIDDEFDIGTIVRINAAKLLDAYALQFFHGEIDSEAFRKAREPLFKENRRCGYHGCLRVRVSQSTAEAQRYVQIFCRQHIIFRLSSSSGVEEEQSHIVSHQRQWHSKGAIQ